MDSLEIVKKAGKLADEKKGKDIVILELTGITDIADFFLIISGQNERHVKTIAEHILNSMESGGIRPYSIEGFENGRWVIIDYNTVVVHVFLQSLRELYDLESLWFEAKKRVLHKQKTSKG
ncbi:MAG: ribosome silencing factor [Deltaproteobacteria bacterium]|nr:ribosome silencing factor [Deltaproteobacteria bacterium]